MNKKTIRDIDVRGKRILVRVDYNVPMQDGIVTDDKRIRATLPTINYIIEHGGAVVLASHLGRPKGKCTPEFSLRPVADVLSSILGIPVLMAPDCVGSQVEEMANALLSGQVLMLENTRFHPEEEKNDLEYARKLSVLGDVYVNDAFGTAHRAHASTEGVTRFLPAVSGFLMEKELEYLGKAIADPERPFVAILGGAKISDKIQVVETLLGKCDRLLIGGGMANTFLAAQGINVQDSLVEGGAIQVAAEIIKQASDRLLLPTDVVIADSFTAEAQSAIVMIDDIPAGWRIMDIGPLTLEKYKKVITDARLIVWNGPMGVFEMQQFSNGTYGLAKILAESSAITVIGGGDSASAVKKAGVAKQMTHISTGGGASLEFLEGRELPGVKALLDK